MKYNKTCEECSKEFITNIPNKKTCNEYCYRERFKKLSGRSINDIRVSPGTTGAIAELAVSADLMKKGYAVFRALSPACFCDVIAIKDEKVLKIEIRTGYKYPATGRLNFPDKIHGKVDCFGVYERISGEVYYLDLNKKSQKLI